MEAEGKGEKKKRVDYIGRESESESDTQRTHIHSTLQITLPSLSGYMPLNKALLTFNT